MSDDDSAYDVDMCIIASYYDNIDNEIAYIGSLYDNVQNTEIDYNNLNLSFFEFNDTVVNTNENILNETTIETSHPVEIVGLSHLSRKSIFETNNNNNSRQSANSNLIGFGNPSLYTLHREIDKQFIFGLSHKVLEFNSNNVLVNNFLDANNLCKNFFEKIISKYIKPLKRSDRIAIMINHGSFQSPMNLPFLYRDQITTETIWRQFENVIQSKKNDSHFELSDSHKLIFSLKIANTLNGSGPNKKKKKKVQNE